MRRISALAANVTLKVRAWAKNIQIARLKRLKFPSCTVLHMHVASVAIIWALPCVKIKWAWSRDLITEAEWACSPACCCGYVSYSLFKSRKSNLNNTSIIPGGGSCLSPWIHSCDPNALWPPFSGEMGHPPPRWQINEAACRDLNCIADIRY